MVIDTKFFMQLALQEAWKYQVLTYPNPAVGCCVVSKDGAILSVEAHKKAGEAHAEVLALQSAYIKLTNDTNISTCKTSQQIHNYLLKHHNSIFKDVKLFTTLEPCSHVGKTPSCANLIKSLGIKNVFVGSNDTNKLASCGNEILLKSGADVKTSILQKECDELLYPFKKFLDGRFVFFKWAQRLDGSVDGGTISSKNSRLHVHKLRDRCDLLIIGGNTVRTDRPTLDARLVDGKAPDVLILSKQKEFDKTIPLFGVDGRKVFIDDSFEILKNYKNIMIEGGAKMFELSKEFVDFSLCYVAPSFGGSYTFGSLDEKFDVLNVSKEDEDIIMWLKRK